jgi:hypothetical protein
MSDFDEVDGPVGIGGWMNLFLFGFAGVTPIVVIVSSYQNLYSEPQVAQVFGETWGWYQGAEWALVAGTLALIAYVVWRLVNVRNWRSVQLTIAAIPTISLGIMTLDLLLTAWWLDMDVGLLAEGLGKDVVRGLFYCAVWCSYFAVSKRVRNTYPRTDVARVESVFD